MCHRAALLSTIMLCGVLLGASPALAEEAGSLTPAPGQLEFGAVDMHFGGSPRESVQFSNAAVSAVLVGSASITGAGASSFQIVGDGCSGRLLQPFETCGVEVAFHPASGSHNASLELLGGEAAVAVPLSGSGITGTLSASPDPLSFSPIPYTPAGHEGEYQENEQVNVLNSHDAGTQIESVHITGPDASSFSIQYGNCEGDLLAPDNSCDVEVRFAASSPGPKRASLVLSSDSSGTPLVVPLEGEALNGPQVSASSTQALLGDVLIGSSAQHTFTLTNTGDYPLFVQQDFLISGTPLMFPMLADTCSAQIVYVGDSCELTVGFEPTTTGEKDASIVLITNASPIHVLGIDGIGVRPVVVSTPALTTPLASPVEAPSSAPAPTSAAAASGGETGPAFPPSLTVEKAPRLLGSIARAALDTGLIAQCPASRVCETVSFMTANIRVGSPHTAGRDRSTRVVLGSALSELLGGQRRRVRIPLSRHALTLLRQRSHLRASIETIVRVGGRVVAEHTGLVTLTAPTGALRTAAARDPMG